MAEEFYTPEGQVKEPKAAEELAHLEVPARNREAELKRETEAGLTKKQEDNLAIVNGIQEKYPNAVEEIIDDKGRKILSLEMWGPELTYTQSRRLYFSQEGVFAIASYNNAMYSNKEFDITTLVDAAATYKQDKYNATPQDFPHEELSLPVELVLNEAGKERHGELSKNKNVKYDIVIVHRYRFLDEGTLKSLSHILATNEASKVTDGGKLRERTVAQNPDEILSKL